MSETVLRMYTVYHRPADLPAVEYAVRAFSIGPGSVTQGLLIGIGTTLDEVRRQVPACADVCMARSPEDDPAIVEIWF